MIDELTTKARDAVGASRDLLAQGDTNGAVNRAYYGVFNITRAYLSYIGLPIEGRHGAIVQAFGQNLVKSGLLDKKFGRLFNQLQEARSDADYTVDNVPYADAEQYVAGAEQIYDEIVKLIPPGLLTSGLARKRSQAEELDLSIRRSLASAFCRAVESRGLVPPLDFEDDLVARYDQVDLTRLIAGLGDMNDLSSYIEERLPGFSI